MSAGCGRCFKAQHVPRVSLIYGGVSVEIVYHRGTVLIGQRIEQLSPKDSINLCSLVVN